MCRHICLWLPRQHHLLADLTDVIMCTTAVAGGFPEPLRVGGCVEVTNKDTTTTNPDAAAGPIYRQGVIIELDTQFRKAKVVYRDCPKRTTHAVESFEALRAVPEVVLGPAFFSPQYADLLAVSMFFLQTKLHEPQPDEGGRTNILRSWDAIYTQMKSCSVIALASLLANTAAVSLFVEKGTLLPSSSSSSSFHLSSVASDRLARTWVVKAVLARSWTWP